MTAHRACESRSIEVSANYADALAERIPQECQCKMEESARKVKNRLRKFKLSA